MIKVDNLVKRFGKFTAVDHLSFDIEQGEIFGFVGSNGAGKTTTMKIANGLMLPTSGTVYVDGIDVVKDPMGAKHRIGYMPDFFGVYDDLKTSEYMDFYCGVYKIPQKQRASVIEPLVHLVNLDHKMDAYVDDLSRGMKQRLCLARALIHNPDILILDEPASGLDPRARVEFREIVKTLNSMGKTILISSHILLELAEICTTIGIISHGKLVIKGTVSEIQKHLAHLNRIKMKTASDLDQAMLVLREIDTVKDLQIANGGVEFSFTGDDGDKAALLKRLIQKEVQIFHFEETSGSLESIFMQLTKEDDND